MADPRKFIDRMLETENLTDYLEDDDADYLINWGVAQLREKVEKIEDLDAAGESANDLMGFMRQLNQVAGNLGNIQQADLVQLTERHQKAFGPGRDLTSDAYVVAASQLAAMTPHQAIDYLLQLFSSEKSPPVEESPSSSEVPASEDSSPEQTDFRSEE